MVSSIEQTKFINIDDVYLCRGEERIEIGKREEFDIYYKFLPALSPK